MDRRGPILRNADGVGNPSPGTRGSSLELATPGFGMESLWDEELLGKRAISGSREPRSHETTPTRNPRISPSTPGQAFDSPPPVG